MGAMIIMPEVRCVGTDLWVTTDESECLEQLRGCLAAARRCHARGVFHRDVHPFNFFMLSEKDDTIIMADFGKSRLEYPVKLENRCQDIQNTLWFIKSCLLLSDKFRADYEEFTRLLVDISMALPANWETITDFRWTYHDNSITGERKWGAAPSDNIMVQVAGFLAEGIAFNTVLDFLKQFRSLQEVGGKRYEEVKNILDGLESEERPGAFKTAAGRLGRLLESDGSEEQSASLRIIAAGNQVP